MRRSPTMVDDNSAEDILASGHRSVATLSVNAPFRLTDLPVDVQLVVFGHYFNSFGGYFRPYLESFAANFGGKEQAQNARLGPTALLLANKTMYEAALGIALQTRTTLLCGSTFLDSFMTGHAQRNTSQHIRRLTLSLSFACELGDYEMMIPRMARLLPMVETIELHVTQKLSGYFSVGLKRAQSSYNAMCHYTTLQTLPSRLKHYTVRCPEIERAVQRALNELKRTVYTRFQKFCFDPSPRPSFIGINQQLCKSEVPLSDLVPLTRDEREALIKHRNVIPELSTVPGELAMYL